MVETVSKQVPRTGYDIGKIRQMNGSMDPYIAPYLLVEVAGRTDPHHLIQDFALYIGMLFRTYFPNLGTAIESLRSGQVYSVIAFDRHQSRIEVAVRSGGNRGFEVIIQPLAEKYTGSEDMKIYKPSHFLENCRHALERDLVSE